MGFSSENSHRIVDMDMCIMLHPSLFALVEPLRGLLFDLVEDRRAAHIRMTLTDQGIDLLLENVGADGLETAERLTEFAEGHGIRSEEHTSELQSLMRNSYAVFCLKKKTITTYQKNTCEIQTLKNILKVCT